MVDRAIRIAQAERTVTCVIVPADIQDMDAVEEQPKTHTVHSGVGLVAAAGDPLDRPAAAGRGHLERRRAGGDAGRPGAMHATDEVLAVADALGAGVAKALLGKAAVPDDVPTAPARSGCWAPSRRGT